MRVSRVWAVLLLCLAAGSLPAQETTEETRESGIVEQAERRLMQIDVTVRGPAETVEALKPEDFKLTVGREDIEEFVLDRVCIDGGVGDLDLEQQPELADARPKLPCHCWETSLRRTTPWGLGCGLPEPSVCLGLKRKRPRPN